MIYMIGTTYYTGWPYSSTTVHLVQVFKGTYLHLDHEDLLYPGAQDFEQYPKTHTKVYIEIQTIFQK